MSKARSPRDVCSTTIGINGLIRFSALLTSWGPDLLLARSGFLLLGRPELLARVRQLGRDPRRALGDRVERLAQPQVLLQPVERVGRLQHPLDRLRLLALPLERLAYLLVGHLEAELVRDRLEHD